MKLVFVRRREHGGEPSWGPRRPRFNDYVEFIPTRETKQDEQRDSARDADMFQCPDLDVPALVKHLAEENPGYSIEVYNLEQSAVCPAAAMVVKKVTTDGVLPA